MRKGKRNNFKRAESCSLEFSYYSMWNCDRCGNSASIMEVDEELNKNFPIFKSVPTEVRNQKQSIKEPPNYFL